MPEKKSTSVPIGLLKKYDRPGPRYTSYPTVPVWTDNIGPDDYSKSLQAAASAKDEPLALYFHIPFCKKRCFYCGCTTVVSRNRTKLEKYIESLTREIEQTAALLGQRKTVSQLHFGGGTPTFLSTDEFQKILDAIDSNFTFTPDYEKSLEIDPRITTTEQIDFLAGQGFNRISIGVQDFDTSVQEAIGRVQSFDLVENMLHYCRSRGFKGINIDLIYGLPRQTPESFISTLQRAINLRPDRVAVYSFAFLPKVKAHQQKINKDELPQTVEKYRLFASAVEQFTGAGYRQIGMDHFALPDDELSLALADGRLHRNFMGYTVKSSPDMVGLGMSSIGYIDNAFFQNFSLLDKYMTAIDSNSLAIFRGIKLTEDDLIRQYVITSLMCNFKLGFQNFKKRFGVEYHDYFKQEHPKLNEFVDDGLLDETDSGLKITPVGRTFVRNIAMIFDAYLGKETTGEKPTFSRTI